MTGEEEEAVAKVAGAGAIEASRLEALRESHTVLADLAKFERHLAELSQGAVAHC